MSNPTFSANGSVNYIDIKDKSSCVSYRFLNVSIKFSRLAKTQRAGIYLRTILLPRL